MLPGESGQGQITEIFQIFGTPVDGYLTKLGKFPNKQSNRLTSRKTRRAHKGAPAREMDSELKTKQEVGNIDRNEPENIEIKIQHKQNFLELK